MISNNKLKVFIADDSDEIRFRLIRILSAIQAVEIVGQAKNVPDSIKHLKYLKCDIVLLDMKMPGGTGFDVLSNIRKENNKPLVIILTNYATEEMKQKSIKEGADYFFDKSSEFDNLFDLISNLVINT